MNEPDPPEDSAGDARLDAVLRAAFGAAPARPDDTAEPEDDPIDDGVLRAWRAGALDDEAAAAFEARLAEDRDARDLAAAVDAPVSDALLAWAEQQAPRAPRRQAPTWGGLALAAVALVAIGAALMWRGSTAPPAYVTSPLAGAAATVRSEAVVEGTPVFRTQGVLQVTLRPEVAGEAPKVSAFVARPDGPLKAVEIDVETPAGGAVVISAPARELFGAEYGEWRFYVALGDASDAAGQPFADAREGGGAWFEYPLLFEPVADDGGAP